MPIEGMYWDSGVRAMEVHVMVGTTSPDLRIAHLQFQVRDADNDPDSVFAAEYFQNNADVTLTFTIADASKDAGASTRTFTGISVNRDSGAVTVNSAATMPALFPQNFLIEAHATTAGQPPFRELIRVHIHRSIQRIWLTPAVLNLRPMVAPESDDTIKQRFALRGRFDDETVGDLTDFPGVTWASKRGTTATTHVDAEGALRITAADVGAADVTVTATLPGVAAPASATIHAVASWGPAAPIDARLVPGGGWPLNLNNVPLPFAPEAVANVLFIPDGYPAGSSTAFFKYVNGLVKFIQTSSLCKPYDLLAKHINFWAAFIPSAQAGYTWGSEVFAGEQIGTKFLIDAVPKPRRPRDRPVFAEWDLDRLIYEVGLATPADRPGTGRTNAQIEADWTTLFGGHFATHLPSDSDDKKDLIDSWRALGTRTILDDIDTPLGLMSGAPRADENHNLIDLNPDRMDRDRINDLISALRHDQVATSGLILNTLWINKRRRNFDLVCIVSAGLGREINGTGYFMISQGSDGIRLGTPANINDITPDPITIRDVPNDTEARVFAHELSHSFDLGDEYGGTNDRPLFPVDMAHGHRIYGNLTFPDAVKVGGAFNGDEIKWRWPRIRWAAEVIGPITNPSPNIFVAPIRLSHAFGFPLNEIVHFRFRNIDFAYRDKFADQVHFDQQSSYLTKLPKVSVPLRLREAPMVGTPAVQHVKLEIDSAFVFPYPAGQKVAAADIIAAFPPGSIVYSPTPAPAGALDPATYPYAELIAKNIKAHVTFLNAPVGETNDDLSLPEKPHFDSLPLPAWFPKASAPLIVALYEGGSGNSKGMFHPTGNCMMNDQNSGARFCHVCKYMLVDAIDPSRHFFIDPEYVAIYPQR